MLCMGGRADAKAYRAIKTRFKDCCKQDMPYVRLVIRDSTLLVTHSQAYSLQFLCYQVSQTQSKLRGPPLPAIKIEFLIYLLPKANALK